MMIHRSKIVKKFCYIHTPTYTRYCTCICMFIGGWRRQPDDAINITTARILTLSQPPIDCPVVYYVESKIWTHVTIAMYVSLCNSNVSAHEKQ